MWDVWLPVFCRIGHACLKGYTQNVFLNFRELFPEFLPFHSISNRKSRNFWSNGKRPGYTQNVFLNFRKLFPEFLPFHSISNRKSRNFWSNGKRPKFSIIPEIPTNMVHSKRIPKFSKTFPGIFTVPFNFEPEISEFWSNGKRPLLHCASSCWVVPVRRVGLCLDHVGLCLSCYAVPVRVGLRLFVSTD